MRSGEIYSTVPTRSDASRSIGVVIITYTVSVEGVEEGTGDITGGTVVPVVVVPLDDEGVVGLEEAPKRCCNSSAILIVALSIADLGR